MSEKPLPALFAPSHPYKGFEPVMGVWAIRCTANGKLLVGASLHARGAINKELFTLKLGKHRNPQLQADFRAHGAAAFTSEILHVLERREGGTEATYASELAELERLCLDELRPWGERGYNEGCLE